MYFKKLPCNLQMQLEFFPNYKPFNRNVIVKFNHFDSFEVFLKLSTPLYVTYPSSLLVEYG